MSLKFSHFAAVLALSSALTLPAAAQAAPQTAPAAGGAAASGEQPKWKDQAEYDMSQAANTAATPQARVQALQAWKEKYPDSAYKKERAEALMAAYAQANDVPNAKQAARDVIAIEPNSLGANILLTQAALANTAPTPTDLSEAETSAAKLAELLNGDAAKGLNDQQKAQFRDATYRTRIWAATQRKDVATAEKVYTEWISSNPQNAQLSLYLGMQLLQQKDDAAARQRAIYHLARAGAVQGAGALQGKEKQAADQYFNRYFDAYTQKRADKAKLLGVVGSNPLPPSDLSDLIPNGQVIIDKENEARKQKLAANPSLQLWESLKATFTADNGEQTFNSQAKGSKLPELTGKLVSQSPEVKPNTLVLAVEGDQPQITVKFETPLPGKADPGTAISVAGVAESFTKEPFTLTMSAERGDIKGWPVAGGAPAKAAPGKKAAPARRPAARKK